MGSGASKRKRAQLALERQKTEEAERLKREQKQAEEKRSQAADQKRSATKEKQKESEGPPKSKRVDPRSQCKHLATESGLSEAFVWRVWQNFLAIATESGKTIRDSDGPDKVFLRADDLKLIDDLLVQNQIVRKLLLQEGETFKLQDLLVTLASLSETEKSAAQRIAYLFRRLSGQGKSRISIENLADSRTRTEQRALLLQALKNMKSATEGDPPKHGLEKPEEDSSSIMLPQFSAHLGGSRKSDGPRADSLLCVGRSDERNNTVTDTILQFQSQTFPSPGLLVKSQKTNVLQQFFLQFDKHAGASTFQLRCHEGTVKKVVALYGELHQGTTWLDPWGYQKFLVHLQFILREPPPSLDNVNDMSLLDLHAAIFTCITKEADPSGYDPASMGPVANVTLQRFLRYVHFVTVWTFSVARNLPPRRNDTSRALISSDHIGLLLRL